MSYAAYCRVSTDEQAKGENILSQIDIIENYCKRQVINNIPFYLDDGISGTLPLRDRPEGNRLLLDILEKKINTVIIKSVDRLARDDYVAQETYHIFKNAEVNLISINESFNYFDPAGQLMASTFSSFAAYDRSVIRQRFAEGKVRHAKQGKLPQANIPFGYYIDEKCFVIVNEEQAKIIRLIYKLYIEDNLSMMAIRDYLNSMKIPAPSTYKKQYNHTKGTWSDQSVTRILSSSYYADGEYDFKPPDRNKIIVKIPPIVDIDLYNTARKIAETKRQNTPPPATYKNYLLRGLIFCRQCESSFTGTSNTKGLYKYYRCTRKKLPSWDMCNTPQVNAEMVEKIIWEDIKNVFTNPSELIKEITKRMSLDKDDSSSSIEDELDEINKKLNKYNQEKKRLYDLYADGSLSKEDIIASIEERNKAITILEERIAFLDNTRKNFYNQNDINLKIIDKAHEISNLVQTADDETKRELFLLLVDKIYVYPSPLNPKTPEISVKYNLNINTRGKFSLVK